MKCRIRLRSTVVFTASVAATILAPLGLGWAFPQASDPARLDFVTQIQPILKAACHRCHGPDMQMGRLRLDSKALALQGGLSGKAIVPNKPSESLLLQRVVGEGDKVRM